MEHVIADASADYAAHSQLKVADEVWIGTALLHREHPKRQDFTIAEIRARVQREAIGGAERPGVQPHISRHCVANQPPSPGSYRMLYETGPSRRRLYRPTDPHHDKRRGKLTPERPAIPAKYRALLDWYRDVYARQGAAKVDLDPLLGLRGLG